MNRMRNLTIINIFIAVLSLSGNLNAQTIGKPSLGFSMACASPSFNTYNIKITYSLALSSTNKFIIELSDETGSFSTPTTVFTSDQGAVTTSPATLTFAVPTTIAGEGYKVRVKSTSPVATSTPSIVFPAYYKLQDTPFNINNLIATGVYCSGGSYLLTIDNPGTTPNDSPLKYPSLTFNWYKKILITDSTSEFIASGNSLSVNEPGIYFVETNYGSCTSNSYSNRVTVSQASSSASAEINSSLGNPFCSSGGPTVLATVSGDSYQWYKDGTEIPGETKQFYETDKSGLYLVSIGVGDCVISASIDLDSNGFTSSIDVLEENVLELGETLIATVTTDANTPEFEWYLNDSLITGAINDSFEASENGNYKVIIRQTVGCLSTDEILFSREEPTNLFPDVAKIPNVITPNGDGDNDTWVIPQEYVNGTNAEVILISAQGEIVLQTNNYQNNWPENQLNFKDVNPVYYYIITTQNKTTKKGSITVIK